MTTTKESKNNKVPSEIRQLTPLGGQFDPPHDEFDPPVTHPLISCGKVQLAILRMLRDGWKRQTIAQNLGISLSTTKTHLRRLRLKGLINNKNEVLIKEQLPKVPQEDILQKTLIVGYDDSIGTDRGDDLKRTFVSHGTLGTMRAHNLKLSLELKKRPHDLLLASWRKVDLRYNVQYHTTYEGMHLSMTTKSLNVQLPPIDVEDAQDAINLAAQVADKLKLDLERAYAGLELGEVSVKTQEINAHFAFQGHPFATWLTKQGAIINSGSVHIDASKPDGVPELEIVEGSNGATVTESANAYREHIKDQMNPKTPLLSALESDIKAINADLSQIRTLFNESLQIVKLTLAAQQTTAEQLKYVASLTLPKPQPEEPQTAKRGINISYVN